MLKPIHLQLLLTQLSLTPLVPMVSTITWLLVTAPASFILCLLTYKKFVVGRPKLKLPPSPNKLPIIGNLHQLGALPHRSLWSLSKKFGPIMHLQLGRVPTVVVSSAELAREVLKTQDLNFCNRPELVAQKKITYDCKDISCSQYGTYWREMRKICMLELFSAKRVHSFSSVRHEEISLMLESIACSSSVPVNFSELMISLLSNILCRVGLGKKFHGEYKTSRFHEILLEAQALMGCLFVSDYFPSMGWIDTLRGLHGRLEKNTRELDAIYEEVIEEHFNPSRPKPDQEDIVDVLLRVAKDNTHVTRDHIKAILVDIFIAGTETGAATLVWAMSELARNPMAMEKAREEVHNIVGMKGKVEEGDLHKLQYLKSVVKETFRLHSPIPLLLPHESTTHCKINGYNIPQNTRVLVNAWAIGRDPESWKDPEEFLPERFMDSTIDITGKDFELLPFGSGRRSCPAMYLAALTIELVLANLLSSFDWKLPTGIKEEDIDMTEAPGLTMHKRSALHLVPSKYVIRSEN